VRDSSRKPQVNFFCLIELKRHKIVGFFSKPKLLLFIRDITMKIPIFSFPCNCWKCNKKMKVTYPTTEDVYKTELRGNLAPTYSNTRHEHLIGNLCPFCKAYQGNFFVMNNGFMGNAYELETYLVGFFSKELRCINCGKEIHSNNEEDLFTKVQIYESNLAVEELSSSETKEEHKQRSKCYGSYVLCKRCLENDC